MININGKSYTGNNITISNNKVMIDGVAINETPDKNGILKVVIEGNLNSVTSDCAVEVHGNVEGNVKAGMNADILGNVGEDVKAGMNVTCKDVQGNVDAKMNVTCKKICGNADARMGITRSIF